MKTMQDTTVELSWDEPASAISPRGWLAVAAGHPDEWHRNWDVLGCRTCGWYLDYSDSACREGKPAVLARAYVFRLRGGCVDLGTSEWFATIGEAKRWIEVSVAKYLRELSIRESAGG